jgi:hypothetical protein
MPPILRATMFPTRGDNERGLGMLPGRRGRAGDHVGDKLDQGFGVGLNVEVSGIDKLVASVAA